MKYIERGWQAYCRLGVPQGASDAQVEEIRQAFFSGAAVLFKGLLVIMDPSPEPTNADLEKVGLIAQELEEFELTLNQKIFKTAEH